MRQHNQGTQGVRPTSPGNSGVRNTKQKHSSRANPTSSRLARRPQWPLCPTHPEDTARCAGCQPQKLALDTAQNGQADQRGGLQMGDGKPPPPPPNAACGLRLHQDAAGLIDFLARLRNPLV